MYIPHYTSEKSHDVITRPEVKLQVVNIGESLCTNTATQDGREPRGNASITANTATDNTQTNTDMSRELFVASCNLKPSCG